jgi:hypothetical protein
MQPTGRRHTGQHRDCALTLRVTDSALAGTGTRASRREKVPKWLRLLMQATEIGTIESAAPGHTFGLEIKWCQQAG